ncbi:hypothetical protein BDGGKGIB_02265 [Nodularia sphaerocarpa UHCC 0038]|nr:hypothetical protein BDGGKGIB_02265 [Nodularia sphaerocarpa UHCC 0038]
MERLYRVFNIITNPVYTSNQQRLKINSFEPAQAGFVCVDAFALGVALAIF